MAIVTIIPNEKSEFVDQPPISLVTTNAVTKTVQNHMGNKNILFIVPKVV
jgi:hypothetical protein